MIKIVCYCIALLFLISAFSINPFLFLIVILFGAYLKLRKNRIGRKSGSNLISTLNKGILRKNSIQSDENYVWHSVMEFLNLKSNNRINVRKFSSNISHNTKNPAIESIENYKILFYEKSHVKINQIIDSQTNKLNFSSLYGYIEYLYDNGLYSEISKNIIKILGRRAKFLIKYLDEDLYRENINCDSVSYLIFLLGGIIKEKTSNVVTILTDKYEELKIIERRLNRARIPLEIVKKDWMVMIKIYFILRHFNPLTLGIKEEKENKHILKNNFKKKTPENVVLPEDLSYLSPIIKMVNANRTQNNFVGKSLLSSSKKKRMIPEQLLPLLEDQIEDSINQSRNKINASLEHSFDLNQAVKQASILEESRETLKEFKLNIKMSNSHQENIGTPSKMYLSILLVIFLSLSVLISSQSIHSPDGLIQFVVWSIITIIPGVLSIFLKNQFAEKIQK